MYLLLFFILCGLTIAIFFLFKKDILSPSFLFSFMFTVSVLAAIIAQQFWNDVLLNWQVFLFPIIGIFCCTLGEGLVRFIFSSVDEKAKQTKSRKKAVFVPKIFHFKPIVVVGIICFLIVTLIFLIIEMSRITGINGNIPEMINQYRSLTPLFNEFDANVSISTILVQFTRIANVLGMISLFVIINNLICGDKIKNNIPSVIIVLLASIIMLFIAGRSCLIQYVLFGFGLSVLLYRKSKNGIKARKIERKKIVRNIIMAIVVVTPLFYLIMPLIGRTQIGGPIGYLTFYLGNPLPSMQQLIDDGRLNPGDSMGGHETFNSVRSIMGKFDTDIDYAVYQNTWAHFRPKNDDEQLLASNTFTGMKPYYADWGIIGVMICQFLFGAVFSALYLFTCRHNSRVLYLLYGMFIINIITQVNSERLFSAISISTIAYIVYIVILVYFLLGGAALISTGKKENYAEK